MIFSLEILMFSTANDSCRLICLGNYHTGSRAMSLFERERCLSLINQQVPFIT